MLAKGCSVCQKKLFVWTTVSFVRVTEVGGSFYCLLLQVVFQVNKLIMLKAC